MRPRLVGLILIAACTLGGCESCQRGSQSGSTPPAAVAPTAAPTAAAGPTQAAPAPQEVTNECFVIVDAEPDFGTPPLKVHFTTEIDCTASPVTYSWDFGDGTTGGNDPAPTHTYAKAGDYGAVVTTKSPDGGEGSDEIDITVDESFED
jgi:PKD repeat protein